MDDPTRRCENDTDKWKRVTRARHSGLLFPSKGPTFLPTEPAARGAVCAALRPFLCVRQPCLAVLFRVNRFLEIRCAN